ncbi:hypothetical protein N7481_010228 [Penicillium waksmanii]|uniref:uncharacterized protein n=1 Tax=Penicillium waksmanii TaxID=69791 RepID=UPI0025480801|nr:uncharacterized protein N7481_010228 [Penicillium waksmanii]KAJ5976521.1 hypothetical protein N7481_010228 [Penicillium waksmanii]
MKKTGNQAFSVPQKGKTDGMCKNVNHADIHSCCQKTDSNQTWQGSAYRSKLPSTQTEITPVPSPSPTFHHCAHPPVEDIFPDIPQSETKDILKEKNSVSNSLFHCKTWLRGVPDGRDDNHDSDTAASSRRKFQIVEQPLPMPKVFPEVKSADVPGVDFSHPLQGPGTGCTGAYQKQLTSKLPKSLQVGQASSTSVAPVLSTTHMLPLASLPSETPFEPKERGVVLSRDVPIDMPLLGCSILERMIAPKSCRNSAGNGVHAHSEGLEPGCFISAAIGDPSESSQIQRRTLYQSEPQPLNLDSKTPSPASIYLPRFNFDMSELGDRVDLRPKQPLKDRKWTLRELDLSVKRFPHHIPVLTSPVISFLRKSKRRDLLRPFRVIFPEVTESVLNSLCATVIARNYLFTTSKFDPQKPSRNYYNVSAPDQADAKARNHRGAHSALRLLDQDECQALDPQSAYLFQAFDKIVYHLIFTVVGRVDKNLKSTVEVLAQVLEASASK